MLHWEESEDEHGFPVWLRYVECSHWGLFLTDQQLRWLRHIPGIVAVSHS